MTREPRLMVAMVAAGREGEVATEDARLSDLLRWLRPGDVLIVNDAATLPASLSGRVADGQAIELRLFGAPDDAGRARGVLFGAGDFRTPTEHRPAPPEVVPGDRLSFFRLNATVERRGSLSRRLLDVRFDRSGAPLWSALYSAGRPVQYAYHSAALPLYAVQTAYASRPWAAEMPSAGWPLKWALLLALKRQGVELHTLTHAAGLSATGDAAIDAALPLPERFEIPERTVMALGRARARDGRVIAVGTTVVRALEGCVQLHGELRAGSGVTDLVMDVGFERRVVDGLLTGVHDPTESHFRLLSAFAPPECVALAIQRARELGYRDHEFGDSMLLLSPAVDVAGVAIGPRVGPKRRAA